MWIGGLCFWGSEWAETFYLYGYIQMLTYMAISKCLPMAISKCLPMAISKCLPIWLYSNVYLWLYPNFTYGYIQIYLWLYPNAKHIVSLCLYLPLKQCFCLKTAWIQFLNFYTIFGFWAKKFIRFQNVVLFIPSQIKVC